MQLEHVYMMQSLQLEDIVCSSRQLSGVICLLALSMQFWRCIHAKQKAVIFPETWKLHLLPQTVLYAPLVQHGPHCCPFHLISSLI